MHMPRGVENRTPRVVGCSPGLGIAGDLTGTTSSARPQHDGGCGRCGTSARRLQAPFDRGPPPKKKNGRRPGWAWRAVQRPPIPAAIDGGVTATAEPGSSIRRVPSPAGLWAGLMKAVLGGPPLNYRARNRRAGLLVDQAVLLEHILLQRVDRRLERLPRAITILAITSSAITI